VGTNSSNGLIEHKPIKPVVTPVNGQVWCALAELGRQIQILASAQMGQGIFVPANLPAPAYLPDSPTVIELVNQFLLAKARADKSDRYIRALRNSLSKFVKGRAHQPAHEVTANDLEDWVMRPEWATETQRGYLSDVSIMFNWAVRRKLLRENPAKLVELADDDGGEISIHRPDEVKKILDFARGYDLNLCRALACRYFAGLRTCETDRIEENAFREKMIEVTKATAKGGRARRRRLVTIQPNLRAWLALGGEFPILNSGQKWQYFNTALKEATGIEWLHNAARHSFCSYHIAKFQKMGLTANESGNSEAMLLKHYREISFKGFLVTKEAAAEFFSILPTR
jgi:hypothetical protein